MAKRSIKDSMNDAAFAFVKGGDFEQPAKTNLVSMPQTEEPPAPAPVKEQPKKLKSESSRNKSKTVQKTQPQSDHLVSVSTRMPFGLFAELKKEALLRQLANESPNSLQEILTEAAKEWLKKNAKH